MLSRIVLVALAGALALPMPARGGDAEIPFTITALGFIPEWNGDFRNTRGTFLKCGGPWLRTSDCYAIRNGDKNVQFYYARDGIPSAYGLWTCDVSNQLCDIFVGGKGADILFSKRFCLRPNDPPQVHLSVQVTKDALGTTPGVDVNARSTCPAALASSLLGQDGEDARTPVDVDTYDFAGEAGEEVEVLLDVDGSAGALGGEATLRVLDEGGELARDTGELPLRLEVTLTGPAAIQVRRGGSANDFRGNYTLEVIPASGDVEERVLTPRPNVEG